MNVSRRRRQTFTNSASVAAAAAATTIATDAVEKKPVPFACTVCASPFDDNSRAPRRAPCCRRLICSKCAFAVVSHPTPPPCVFCQTLSAPLELAAFTVDVGVLEATLAASAPPTT